MMKNRICSDEKLKNELPKNIRGCSFVCDVLLSLEKQEKKSQQQHNFIHIVFTYFHQSDMIFFLIDVNLHI